MASLLWRFEQVETTMTAGLIFCWLFSSVTLLWLLVLTLFGSDSWLWLQAPGIHSQMSDKTLPKVKSPLPLFRGPLKLWNNFSLDASLRIINVALFYFPPYIFFIFTIFDWPLMLNDIFKAQGGVLDTLSPDLCQLLMWRRISYFSQCYPQFRKLNRNRNAFVLFRLDCFFSLNNQE